MRLVATLNDKHHANEFSYFLTKEQIENTVDEAHTKHGVQYQVWVTDEDDVDSAMIWYEQFIQNPNDPKFAGHYDKAKAIKEEQLEHVRHIAKQDQKLNPRRWTQKRGFWTMVLTLVSIVIFVWATLVSLKMTKETTFASVELTPLYRALMYDDPAGMDILNKLRTEYSIEELSDPDSLPPEGKALVEQLEKDPFWQGVYGEIVHRINEGRWAGTGPLFEKIGRGELWRLWTPALLHADIWHLIFNIVALIFLSNQVEARQGWWRYLLLVLVSGIVANTAQYLMTGPNFLGLSGVVYALFGFILVRQGKAPWEGYFMTRGLVIFVFTLLVLLIVIQCVSFVFQASGKAPLGINIANTAHIAGLLTGMIFASVDKLSTQEQF